MEITTHAISNASPNSSNDYNDIQKSSYREKPQRKSKEPYEARNVLRDIKKNPCMIVGLNESFMKISWLTFQRSLLNIVKVEDSQGKHKCTKPNPWDIL